MRVRKSIKYLGIVKREIRKYQSKSWQSTSRVRNAVKIFFTFGEPRINKNFPLPIPKQIQVSERTFWPLLCSCSEGVGTCGWGERMGNGLGYALSRNVLFFFGVVPPWHCLTHFSWICHKIDNLQEASLEVFQLSQTKIFIARSALVRYRRQPISL